MKVNFCIFIRCHFDYICGTYWASQMVLVVKNPAADVRDVGLIPGWGRSPGGRGWQPIPVFLPPGELHEQRSLVGYGCIRSHRVRHDWSNLAHVHVVHISCSVDVLTWKTFLFLTKKKNKNQFMRSMGF